MRCSNMLAYLCELWRKKAVPKSSSYICHRFGNFFKQYTACACWRLWWWKMWARAPQYNIRVLCCVMILCAPSSTWHAPFTHKCTHILRYPYGATEHNRVYPLWPSQLDAEVRLGWLSWYQCCRVQPKHYLSTMWLNDSFSECNKRSASLTISLDF